MIAGSSVWWYLCLPVFRLFHFRMPCTSLRFTYSNSGWFSYFYRNYYIFNYVVKIKQQQSRCWILSTSDYKVMSSAIPERKHEHWNHSWIINLNSHSFTVTFKELLSVWILRPLICKKGHKARLSELWRPKSYTHYIVLCYQAQYVSFPFHSVHRVYILIGVNIFSPIIIKYNVLFYIFA